VPVVILREGKTETVQVTLGRREEAEAETTVLTSGEPPKPAQADILGMTLLDRYDFEAMKFSLYFMGYESPQTKHLPY
jgi:hypothetical protein